MAQKPTEADETVCIDGKEIHRPTIEGSQKFVIEEEGGVIRGMQFDPYMADDAKPSGGQIREFDTFAEVYAEYEGTEFAERLEDGLPAGLLEADTEGSEAE